VVVYTAIVVVRLPGECVWWLWSEECLVRMRECVRGFFEESSAVVIDPWCWDVVIGGQRV